MLWGHSMKRILAVMYLWAVSALALADGRTSNFSDFSQSSKDLSIKYLGEVFGSVPGVLHGSGSGLMGQLFYVFNQGIMVVAALFLVYSIFNVVVSSALQPQGPSKHNFALIGLRVAVGLALLVPSSETGYSAIQDVMMKIVVEGTRLADDTWDYALDYLANGGMIYSPPTSSAEITSLTQLQHYMTTTPAPRAGLVNQVFQNEVCMFVSNHYNKKNNLAYGMNPIPPQIEGGKLIAGTGAVYFPGHGDAPASNGYWLVGHPETIRQQCGSISISDNFLVGQKPQTMQYQEAYAALNQLTLDLLPLAKQQANAYLSGGKSPVLSPVAGGKYLAEAVLDYVHLMKPVAAFQASQSQHDKNGFIDYAKEQGWFDAGSFYWDLARWNDALNNAGDPASLTPKVSAFTVAADDITRDIGIIDSYLGGEGTENIWGNGMDQLQQYIDSVTNNNTKHNERVNNHYTTGGADFASIIQNALAGIVGTIETQMDSKHAGSYDPLVMVQEIGKKCLSGAGYIWKKSIAWAIGLSTVMGVCNAQSPTATVMKVMMDWLVPMWMMVSTALFAAGFMLTFYAPLYPYMLFTFGAIGWLLYVVESMIAAPLVCFGMTHPEGHDFLGRADQALMLALGVFIRPVLMVIGFLAGMLLTYVGFSFINTVLGRVFVSMFNVNADPNVSPLGGIWIAINKGIGNNQGDHFTGHDLSDFLLIPMLLVAYGMLVIEVVNQCFSAIHQVPDMVLRWIGMAPQQDMTERYAQSVQQTLSTSARQAGDGAGKAASGFGSTVGSAIGNAAPTGESAKTALEVLNSSGDAGAGAAGAAGA